MMNCTRTYTHLWWILWLPVCATQAGEISARVSRDALAQNETLQLVLETRGQAEGPPDLSPLYRDFDVIGRSQSQSTSVINGNVQSRASLRLTLKPKRAGDLEIPPISFGENSTAATRVQVSPAPADAGQASNYQVPGGPFGFPGPYPQYAAPVPDFSMPDDLGWSQPQPTVPAAPSYAAPAVPGAAVPWMDPVPPAQTPLSSSESQPVTPDEESHLPWLTWLLGLGWLLTAVGWWASRRAPRPQPRRQPAADISPPPAEPPPAAPAQLDPAVLAVKNAYDNHNPVAARDALLQWARSTWQQDSPSNLSRLARLCRPPLRQEVLRLDRALYSPEPGTWWDRPVWEMLSAMSKSG